MVDGLPRALSVWQNGVRLIIALDSSIALRPDLKTNMGNHHSLPHAKERCVPSTLRGAEPQRSKRKIMDVVRSILLQVTGDRQIG